MTSKMPVGERLSGLPPVVSPHARVLILGSFPGIASLRARQYYGHPQNHFWRILEALWPQDVLPTGPGSYTERCQWLLDHRLGVWDVYASCVREGSLDTSIREAIVNDFASLRAHCPGLSAIAHNGAESFKHAPQVLRSLHLPAVDAANAPIESIKLPSTSPANASWSFERKLAAWSDLMARHGLL
jgi:hypoxanthine-DNA glycosylase